ncbi:hypothetical protein [Sphingomonas sp. CLY1604]|uniref:hypothetical protein n=1 Tax=Sphingomonas sp. CLY1604 TaxID=3457786 RepID=UPI003FD73D9D
MEIQSTTADDARVGGPALRSWLAPPRRIGGVAYQGDCVIVRVRQATYQQQSTTFGASSAVFGLAGRGTGFVAGGSGFVDTVHRGVVSVVLEDAAGAHENLELPAELALLEGGTVRLDRINGHVFAATNMSGRQGRVVLLGPSAFVGRMTLGKRHVLLLIGSAMMVPQIFSPHPFLAIATTVCLAVVPLHRMREIRAREDRRERLGSYMAEVMS